MPWSVYMCYDPSANIYPNINCDIFHFLIGNTSAQGCLAGLVSITRDSLFRGCQFEPRIGGRVYLKNNISAMVRT